MDTSRVVVAVGAPSVKWAKAQLVLNLLLLLLWGWQALTTNQTIYVVLTGFSAVAVVLYLWAAISAPRVELILTSDRLEVRRRFRPHLIDRREITAVRGDVPGRPSWSEQVLVETRGGVVRLPPLDRPPAEVIPELQQWAGVGEN